MLEAFQGLMGWGLQYSSVIVESHRNQGYSRQLHGSYGIFVQWSFCKRIMGKLSDLEVLIKKKQDCCLVGRVRRSFQSFTLTVHHRYQVV